MFFFPLKEIYISLYTYTNIQTKRQELLEHPLHFARRSYPLSLFYSLSCCVCVCVRSNTPIYVKPYFMSWLHQLKIKCVTGPVVNQTQVNMIHKRLLTHIWLTKAHTQMENTVTGCHRMVTTWFWKNDLNILTRNSRVRPMSRIDLTPAETTAMGVLPSSVRSALMSRPGGKVMILSC